MRAHRRQIAIGALPMLLSTIALVHCHTVAPREARWVSAWAAAHNVGWVAPDLANTTVRMIVRPTISGRALRVKLANTRAETPVSFSAAFIGVADAGAAVVAGTNVRLTFGGASTLQLAPGEDAWSDAVDFDVKAFER